jgi:hypothetical protein
MAAQRAVDNMLVQRFAQFYIVLYNVLQCCRVEFLAH